MIKHFLDLLSEPNVPSAVNVGPAGGVGIEVILAYTWGVVGGGEHVAGGQWGGEVVACFIVHMEIVLV